MKKKMIMVVAVLTAVSLLTVLAFAGTAENNGYELFKRVLRNGEVEEMESGSGTISIKVTDNNDLLFSASGEFLGNKEEEMSGTFQIKTPNIEKEIQVYHKDSTVYLLDVAKNDVYIGTDHDEYVEDDYRRHGRRENFDEKEFDEKSEAIFDILVGDLQKEFKVIKDEDGTNDLQFELTKAEMPPIINLLASIDHEDDYDYESPEEIPVEALQLPIVQELMAVEYETPELVEDIVVEYLNIIVDLDENESVQGILVQVKVSGLDENGASHDLNVEVKLSGEVIDNPQITPIDLTGKNVYELPQE